MSSVVHKMLFHNIIYLHMWNHSFWVIYMYNMYMYMANSVKLEGETWAYIVHVNLRWEIPGHFFTLCTILLLVSNKPTLCSLRASLRIEDTYIHVPGYHPTIDNPTFFRQRTDDPTVLPSLHKHLWGRVASLGSLILKAEKEIVVPSRTTDSSLSSLLSSGGHGVVKFTNDPLKIVGDSSSLILEWSQPTVVAVARALHHLKCEYKVLTSISSFVEAESGHKRGTRKEAILWKELPPIDLKFRLTDMNIFLYNLVPGNSYVYCVIYANIYTCMFKW